VLTEKTVLCLVTYQRRLVTLPNRYRNSLIQIHINFIGHCLKHGSRQTGVFLCGSTYVVIKFSMQKKKERLPLLLSLNFEKLSSYGSV